MDTGFLISGSHVSLILSGFGVSGNSLTSGIWGFVPHNTLLAKTIPFSPRPSLVLLRRSSQTRFLPLFSGVVSLAPGVEVMEEYLCSAGHSVVRGKKEVGT